MPGPIKADTDKPLEIAYQLFESMVSALQIQLQETKEEQKEETVWLLRAQHTAFSKAHKVLQDHMEEFVSIEEILWDWPAYYRQVYQQIQQTQQGIQALKNRKTTDEALRSTIEEQIVLETTKLQKLKREAHQWVHQAIPNFEKVNIICLQMKRLVETTEEKDQFMGPDMERIAEVSISEKMSILSSLNTLIINIQKILQSWTDFQHHLVVTAPAIVEVCV